MSTELQGAYDESIIDIEMSITPGLEYDFQSPDALLPHPKPGQPQSGNKGWKLPTIAGISTALNAGWSKILVTSSVIAVVFDPLFFYIPYTSEVSKCMGSDKQVQTAALVFRSVTDIPFLVHIICQLHVAITFAASRVSEDESLVFKYEPVSRDQMIQFAKAFSLKLSWRSFLADVFTILPLPQLIIVGVFFDNIGGNNYLLRRNVIISFLLIQYVPRIYQIYIWSTKVKASTLWVKCAYNFFLYLLASHVLGSFWYFFSVQREIACWYQTCIDTNGSESECTFYCHGNKTAALITPQFNTTLDAQCILKVPVNMADPPFDFGMFSDVFKNDIQGKINVLQKISFCIWWGLRNLSSFGTSLETSDYMWENIFAILISIIGLLLFSFLIGNSTQSYMATAKNIRRGDEVREKLRIEKEDIENWMENHGLQEDMKEEIRKNIKEKLEEDISADLDDIYSILPKYTKKVLKRFVGMKTLRNVPMLSKVDGRVLKMISDYLQPVKFQENTMVFRMGEPLDRMVFITDGIMWTYTTAIESSHSGQATGGPLATSFTEAHFLKEGDAYGHMLLQLASSSRMELPISVANVRCHTKVEAFVLTAKDLKDIATACGELWPSSFDYNAVSQY